MAELAARVKREEFMAGAGEHLDIHDGPQLAALLEGVAEGDTDIRIEARGEGGTKPRFNTRLASDEEYVDDWGDDYFQGKENVLSALRAYSARRAGERDDSDVPDDRLAVADVDDDTDGL